MSARRRELRLAARDALITAGTLAGDHVFLPRDWPTNSAKMPNVSIQTPREHKEDVTRGTGPPRFDVVTWLELRCQVAATDPALAETQLEELVDQVEAAIMGLVILPPQRFRRIVAGEYELTLAANGDQHYGEGVLRYGVQYSERFSPIVTATLDKIVVTGPARSDGTPQFTAEIDTDS